MKAIVFMDLCSFITESKSRVIGFSNHDLKTLAVLLCFLLSRCDLEKSKRGLTQESIFIESMILSEMTHEVNAHAWFNKSWASTRQSS